MGRDWSHPVSRRHHMGQVKMRSHKTVSCAETYPRQADGLVCTHGTHLIDWMLVEYSHRVLIFPLVSFRLAAAGVGTGQPKALVDRRPRATRAEILPKGDTYG